MTLPTRETCTQAHKCVIVVSARVTLVVKYIPVVKAPARSNDSTRDRGLFAIEKSHQTSTVGHKAPLGHGLWGQPGHNNFAPAAKHGGLPKETRLPVTDDKLEGYRSGRDKGRHMDPVVRTNKRWI